MKTIFSVDSNVFVGGAEKMVGGEGTVIMFLMKVGVGVWIKKVNKTPTRQPVWLCSELNTEAIGGSFLISGRGPMVLSITAL